MDAMNTKSKVLQRLKEAMSEPGCAILVEGVRDRKALIRAGFGNGNIITVSGRRPQEIIETILLRTASRTGRICPVTGQRIARDGRADGEECSSGAISKVILLMDFDEGGRKLAKRWSDVISGSGIGVDSEVPKKMRWALGIQTVEDLPSALAKFEEKITQRKRRWTKV